MVFELVVQSDTNPDGRRNHGRTWTPQNKELVERLWTQRVSVEEIAAQVGRSYSSVISKLTEARYLKYSRLLCRWFYKDDYSKFAEKNTEHVEDTACDVTCLSSTNSPITLLQEEITMPQPFETKIYIHGALASSMTDAEIFTYISALESEIDTLKAIRTKSTKVEATIEEIQSNVLKIAEYLDNR